MPMQNFVSGLKNNQKGEEKMSRYEEILNSQFKMTDGGRVDYVKDLYTTYCPEVDLQAMIDGGYIDALGDMMEPVLISLDDRSPEVMAYWAKHGMVKEFHGDNNGMNWEAYENKTGYKWVRTEKKDGIQNFHKSWTSFVPVSAFQPENIRRLLSCMEVSIRSALLMAGAFRRKQPEKNGSSLFQVLNWMTSWMKFWKRQKPCTPSMSQEFMQPAFLMAVS